MLLLITNKCQMECPHCMENSLPTDDDKMMTEETFKDVIRFIEKMVVPVVCVSGGEPTEHPLFDEFIRTLRKMGCFVVLISNGDFIHDQDKKERVKQLLAEYPNQVQLQITSTKEYYKSYHWVKNHQDEYLSLGNNPRQVVIHQGDIFVNLLGRAVKNNFCRKQAEKHPFGPACITAASLMWQMPFIKAVQMLTIPHPCKPMVDWRGDIHLSESWLCPSVGNVKDFNVYQTVQFRPCGKCHDYKKFLNNNSPTHCKIKAMMGIE